MEKQNIKFKGLLPLILSSILFGAGLSFFALSCTVGMGPSAQVLAETRQSGVAPSIYEMQNSFRAITREVLPSIVEIQTRAITTPSQPLNPFGEDFPWDFFFSPGPNQENQPPRQPRPRQFESRGLGSGVLVRRQGNQIDVLTNNHVVDGAREIKVVLFDQREFNATLVGKDTRRDLAVIRFESNDQSIKLAKLGDSSQLEVGDLVLAMGSPLGLGFSVTQGIISALGRRGGPGQNINDFIQTDAAINRGNSGGALVNLQGEVVGINTWIATPTGGSVGLGFAIPINNAKRVIEELSASGQVRYGWLGVSVGDPEPDLAQDMGVRNERGAFVFNVFKNSPADKGGIRPGDYIVQLSGRSLRNSSELIQMVGDLQPGNRVEFELIRMGRRQRVNVVIEQRAQEEQIDSMNNLLWPGFTIMPITDELRRSEPRLQNAKGVVIVGVVSRTPAQIAGLREADVIKMVNGRNIQNSREFYEVLANTTQELNMTVIREGVDVTIGIKR
jgi:serine protease Do